MKKHYPLPFFILTSFVYSCDIFWGKLFDRLCLDYKGGTALLCTLSKMCYSKL